MFVNALAGISLVVAVAVNPGSRSPETDGLPSQLSARQKSALMQPLMDEATGCVAGIVAADPRLGQTEINDLIVDSFKRCGDPVRALIDAHDSFYGAGSGQQFFMGPYLDALPATVRSIVGRHAR